MTEVSSEFKTYRRIIGCKIRQKDLKAFVKVFKEDGWKEMKLGKRGATVSYVKNLPNKTRYHMRLYEIDEFLYFLIHHEPTFTADPKFHIIGLFDRFRSKKENVLSSEKLELANYQKGNEYFQDLVKFYSKLQEICIFKIDEDELKYFAMKYGYISLKLPIEILIEDLKDAVISKDSEEFHAIVKKIFEILDFNVIEMNRGFMVLESNRSKSFTLLIQKLKLADLDLPDLGKTMKNFRVTETVLIPSKHDAVSATLSQKLGHLKISVIQPNNFLKIFNIYKNSPMSQDQLQQIFSRGGLIDSNFIEEKLQTVNFSDLLTKTMEIFSYLKEQTQWTYLETLEAEFVEMRNYTKEELNKILGFLTYPVINLVLTKQEPRRFKRDKRINFKYLLTHPKLLKYLKKIYSNKNSFSIYSGVQPVRFLQKLYLPVQQDNGLYCHLL